MLKMVVDHRESRSPVYKALTEHPDIEVEVRELSCGDYLPRSDFGVERKESGDFVASIMDRRLFAQVLRLKDEFAQIVFIVEGNPYATRSGIAPEAIRGAISYLMTIEGVSVLMVDHHRETSAILMTMARHLQEGLGYEVALRLGKPKNAADLSQYLIEGLPGIGPSSAKSLLAHFGSAQAVFNADVANLCQVQGVGKKTAERIREALDSQSLRDGT